MLSETCSGLDFAHSTSLSGYTIRSLLYKKLVFCFLLTILDPPGGYADLARPPVRSGPVRSWWTGRDLNPRPFGRPRQNTPMRTERSTA